MQGSKENLRKTTFERGFFTWEVHSLIGMRGMGTNTCSDGVCS